MWETDCSFRWAALPYKSTQALSCSMRLLLFMVVFAYSAGLYAQPSDEGTGPKQPIILRHADSLIGTTDASGLTRELVGNVHLEQGNVTVYCDHATQYTVENRVLLTGNVKIIQGTVTMTMPRGEYWGNSDFAKGEGGVTIVDRKTTLTAQTGTYSTKTNEANFLNAVHIEDDSVSIYADTVRYFRSSQESYAFGRVVMKAKFQNAVITGDSARNIPRTNYSIIRGRPVLIEVDTVWTKESLILRKDSLATIKSDSNPQSVADSTKKAPAGKKGKASSTTKTTTKKSLKSKTTTSKSLIISTDSLNTTRRDSVLKDSIAKPYRLDTLSITGRTLESFRGDGGRFVVTGNAEILRKTIAATSEKCIYDNNNESIELRGTPVVWADSMQLYADSIWIHVPKKKLSEINAYYSAFMGMRDSTQPERPNQVSGDAIFVKISDDTIRAMRSIGNAKSLYFMQGEKGPDGASRSSCDSLFIIFEQGELEKIVWRGGINSEYFPENLVGGGTQSYYLPAYKWNDNRPHKPDTTPGARSDNRKDSSPAPTDMVKKKTDAAPVDDSSSKDSQDTGQPK